MYLLVAMIGMIGYFAWIYAGIDAFNIADTHINTNTGAQMLMGYLFVMSGLIVYVLVSTVLVKKSSK